MAMFCHECHKRLMATASVKMPFWERTDLHCDWGKDQAPCCVDCGEKSGSTTSVNVPDGSLLVWDCEVLYHFSQEYLDGDQCHDMWHCKECQSQFTHREIQRVRKPPSDFVDCRCPHCSGRRLTTLGVRPDGVLVVSTGQVLSRAVGALETNPEGA